MKRNLTILTVYAIAMAFLESAVVVYMRQLYYADNPRQIFPLRFLNSYDTAMELGREAATVIMILTVALMTERTSRTRTFAAFVFVFGVWDLFYYFWLKVFINWPGSWLEWDVLFLIPSVWLSPWICPAMIAALFVVWGFLSLRTNSNRCLTSRNVRTFVGGAVLVVISFLQPAVTELVDGGMTALSQFMPGRFSWWLFMPGYLLMIGGLSMTLRAPERTEPASSIQ